MEDSNKIKLIKKWISDGEDIELLSMEFDIPMDEIMQYKKEAEAEEKQTTNQFEELKSKLIDLNEKEKRGKTNKAMRALKNKISSILVEIIDKELEETDDIDELKKLSKKITYDVCAVNEITFGASKRRVETKIRRLQQKDAIDKSIKNIPNSVIKLARYIAGEQIDPEKVDMAINTEIQRMQETNGNKMFQLTDEEAKKRVISSIRYLLQTEGSGIAVKMPVVTTRILNKYSLKREMEINLEMVVKNCINNREFEKARHVCSAISKDADKRSPLPGKAKVLMSLINIKERSSRDILKDENCKTNKETEER